MSPLSTKVEFCRLYPNRPEYLFLAVFAFSSPFCYAKTAFSYSRALLSPCTPDLFMVKDVVKSEWRMIDMWSCFRGVERSKIAPLAEKKYIVSREETHRPAYVVSLIQRADKYVVRRSGSKEQRIASSFFCRCCIVTLTKDFVKSFLRIVCYSSVGHDELNAIYRERYARPLENIKSTFKI